MKTAHLIGIWLLWCSFIGLVQSQSVFALWNQWSWTHDAAIEKALQEVGGLKSSVPLLTDELFALDRAQRAENDGQLQVNYREVRDEMVKIIQDIDRSSKSISIKLQEFSRYLVEIRGGLKQLEQTQYHLEVGKKYLDQLLFLVYKMEREIYDTTWDSIDMLKLFVKSDNIPATLVGQDILASLLFQVNDLVNQASTQESQKKAQLEKLTQLKSEAQKSIDYYAKEIQKLQEKKRYLLDFMELYKTKQAVGITALSSAFKSVNETIIGYVDEIINKKYQKNTVIQEALKVLAQEKTPSNWSGVSPLAWPAYPITKITTVFNDFDYEKTHEFKNNFLQIAVPQWSPVYAMRAGVVYQIEEGENKINWVMILHTDGYISTYSYLNSIEVEIGDAVKRGQFIWKSWWEAGTRGAWFISEGQNLTFQIFKDGVAIDPLTVLDLSVVMDRDTVLPEEYRLKYFNDHYVRPIDVTRLQLMKGDTVDERAKSFLWLYAVGPYRNLSFWDGVVRGTNIDRDMVICVGFAESTLGQYLATSNNIGNVGNNDRGDRIAYNNPYYGARLIPLTLNNQYLGHYHTINQLSRYGNAEGKIYASSPINRQTNVLKCLSQIKGFYVPEDYPFRTGENPNLNGTATEMLLEAPLSAE